MKKLISIVTISIICQTALLSQSCLPDGITFTTQSQIDNFQNDYPGCTAIEGSVSVYGDDITNLNGLNSLTSIGTQLRIGSAEENQNPNLQNLEGLNNLISVGASLIVKNNVGLISLSGLENISSVGVDFTIQSNSSLTGITNFNSLTTLNGSLIINDNNSLLNLTGFENVATISNNLIIEFNPVLTNLNGLANVSDIGGILHILENDALPSLSGLNNVSSIGGYLRIMGNDALIDISGLESLSSIGAELKITDNSNLSSISGLSNVTSIDGELILWGNFALPSLSGLDQIAAGSITNLEITNNVLLSECDVQSICDYLASPNGSVEITNNNPGCNTSDEIEAACLVGIDEINADSFTLYPNPATHELFITSDNNIPINEIIIYNQLGQNVLHQKYIDKSIDVSAFHPGIYILELVSGSSKVRKKLVIE